MAWIYWLLDPKTSAVKYIGKTIRLDERLRSHLTPSSPFRIVIVALVRKSRIDKIEQKEIKRYASRILENRYFNTRKAVLSS